MFVTRNSTTNCLKITQRIKHIMKYFIGQCPSNDQMIRPLNIIQRRNFLNIGKNFYICDIYYSITRYETCFEALCIHVHVYVL